MAGLKSFAVRLSFENPGKPATQFSFRRVNAVSNLSAIQKAFKKVRAQQGFDGHASYGTEKTNVEVQAIGEPC